MADQPTMYQGRPVHMYGAPLQVARAAMVMIHGRGGEPSDILSLAHEIEEPGVAYLAPGIADGVLGDESWLWSALAMVGEVCDMVSSAGIPPERTLLLGFSQGACLALEYAARNPRRYGGIIGLSGTLVENGGKPRTYGDSGSLAGTPAFLGCSDFDPNIPEDRLQRTIDLLSRLGAEVTVRIYPDMGHAVNHSELEFVRNMVTSVLAGGEAI
jgi:phospholipase/carboxylesterase